MYVEKLIRVKGKEIKEFPHLGSIAEFHIKYEFWYDERLFLIGNYQNERLKLIDAETGGLGASGDEFPRKPSVESLIELFRQKIDKSGTTIHEVIRNYKLRNNIIELWFTNLII